MGEAAAEPDDITAMAFLKIILVSVVAAILYGEIHDQITAHVCVEYFTIGHPRIIESEDPTMLALAWGVVATWWAGILIGVPVALAARLGPWPKLGVRELVPGIAILLVVMAVCATGAGLVAAGQRGDVMARKAPELAAAISPERRHLFMADWAAHSTSYAVGYFGGIALAMITAVRRWQIGRQMRFQPDASTRATT